MHIFEYVCGRFDNLIARDAYRGLFEAQRLPKSNFPLRYNVAPTDQIPIVHIDPRDGEREDYDRWLGPTTSIDDLKAMLKPYDPALMEAYAVNRAVNSVKNDTEKSLNP